MSEPIIEIPRSTHFAGMGLVLFIILIVITLIFLIIYFISQKKEWSTKKKFAIIGFVIGCIWFTISVIGTFSCGWNPVEGSVVKSGVCKNYILLFGFYLLSIFSIFPPLTYSIIGLFIGWIFEKFKKKN